jgi:hypothetical protein
MSTKVMGDRQVVGEHSEWVENSQLYLRAQRIRKTNKIIIDVTEFSQTRVLRPGVALKHARILARKLGASCTDVGMLGNSRKLDKKVSDALGQQHIVKIRMDHFVFGGVL